MINTFKRTLSLLLLVSMVLGLFPAVVFAEEGNVEASSSIAESAPPVDDAQTVTETEMAEAESSQGHLAGAYAAGIDPSTLPMPQADKEQIVIDYGKAVEISLKELKNHIYVNHGATQTASATVGTLAGLTSQGENGKLLEDLPEDIGCTSSDPTYRTENGTFTLEEDVLVYKLHRFLSDLEQVYAVYELKDCYDVTSGGNTIAYRYILVEIEIVPASVMYYEAEDFADQPHSPIQSVITSDGGATATDWEAGSHLDKLPAGTNHGQANPDDKQDFDRVPDTVYDMTIDRETIPYNAFYVDFDGEGFHDRYMSNPLYSGYDFDTASRWTTKANGGTKAFSIDGKAATISVDVSADHDGTAAQIYGPYIATAVTAGTYPVASTASTLPLHYIPTGTDYVQIRFKVEGCSFVANKAPYVNVTYNYTNRANASGYAEDFGGEFETKTLGQFQTVTIPVPSTVAFAEAQEIRSVMLRFQNIKAPSATAKGKVVIDYIYMGPKEGLPEDVKADPRMDENEKYLFFDFTNTATDQARYKGKQYNGFNFDSANNWVGRTTGWNDGTDSVSNGAITVKAAKTKYSSIYIDSGIANDNSDRLFDFDPTYAEVFQIRFKATNLYGTADTCARVQFYETASQSYTSSYAATFDLKYLTNGQYVTVVGEIKPEMRKMERLRRIVVWIGSLDDTKTTTAGTVTFDHVYVGPRDQLERINRERSYLYFTFDNKASDQYRYKENSYNGFNFDLATSWEGRTTGWTNGTDKVENGAITVKAGETDYTSIYIDSGVANDNTSRLLNFDPTNAEVFQIRFKASNLGGNSATSARVQFYASAASDYKSSNAAKFDLKYLTNGEYVTVSGTFTQEMRQMDHVRRLVVWLGDLDDAKTNTNSTVTYDHVFIGPRAILDEINAELAGQSSEKPRDYLYFGFEDTDADKFRYANPVYGDHLNHDTPSGWSGGTNTTLSAVSGGVMTFKDNQPTPVTSGSGDNVYVQTQGTLAFKPGANHYALVRLKLSGARAKYDDGMVGFRIDYKDENGTLKSSPSTSFPLAEYVNKGYFVLRVPMGESSDTDYLTTNTVTQVRPVLVGTHDAEVTLDFLYIGPIIESNPCQKGLYFGFDNYESDRHRYSTDVYEGIQYDRTGTDQNADPWYSYIAKIESLSVDSEAGVMKIVANGRLPEIGDTGNYHSTYPNDNDVYPDVYFDTVLENDHNRPLDYKPDEAMVYQVRFKMKNFALTTYTTLDGTKHTTSYPYVTVQYRGNGINVNCSSGTSENFDPKYLNNNEYITVTMPLTSSQCDAMRNCANINRFRFFFGGMESISESQKGEVVIDYLYIGPGENAPTVYGYDPGYADDPALSNGESLFVEGKGINLDNKAAAYTESYFTFTGTGFDLISRTGKEQATIRVSVYSDRERKTLVKSLTVNNKGELELFQIPVASVQGLPYGTYYVTVGVNKAVTYGMVGNVDMSFMNRGGEFYFDAVRIYDPMNVELTDTHTELDEKEQIALDVYKIDREAYAHIKEIRNILLRAEDFDALVDSIDGAVFIDVNSSIVDPDDNDEDGIVDGNTPGQNYTTFDIQTYNKVGPKNEVYLAPEQAVAFKLQIDSTRVPESLDIGVKIIDGSCAELAAGIVGKKSATENELAEVSRREDTIASATAQYYPLSLSSNAILSEKDSNGNTVRYVYVVIYNNSAEDGISLTDQVLSVTDVKVAYAADPNTVLPEDLPTDPEILPGLGPDSPEEEGTGEDTAAILPDAPASDKKASKTEAAPVRFMVDGFTAKAVEVFLKGLMETPLDDVPTVAEGIRILHSLDLASDISVNYAVSMAQLEGYEDMTLHCALPVYEGNVRIGTKTVVLQPVEKGNYYYFTLNGLTAINMNDVIEASLSMTKEGKTFVSPVDTYSIAQYAYSQMNKTSVPVSLKTLCADLLRYGANSQIYKGYRVDSLADGAMTEEHKAYLSDTEAVTFGNTNRVLDDLPAAPITWVGKSLNLESKVALKLVFRSASYEGDLTQVSARISYTDVEGKTKTLTLTNPEVYNTELEFYAFTVDCLLAAELRSVVSAQIFEGTTALSATLQYAPDAYGNNKEGNMLDLCKALFAYSDSARSYFIG